MASALSIDPDVDQVITEENHHIRKIILNRPRNLNSLDYKMIMQLKKAFEKYEVDDAVKLLIFTGQGKTFSSGGNLFNFYEILTKGHWSLAAKTYSKLLLLLHLIATYNKPVVMLMNGVVMGGGAGMAMNANFQIVTENTVFAMPEVFIGSFVDVGMSYFLSRLCGHYGEYLSLTGARISGTEMLASNLATHFVLSKDLKSLEDELTKIPCINESTISNALEKFSYKPNLKPDMAFTRLDIINKCFSKKTVEDILTSLESEVVRCGDKWLIDAINSMKSASPTSLKISLKNIREGRHSTREECLRRDYIIFRHIVRGQLSRDVYEGTRAVAIDKDKRPKWNPQVLEEVSDEFVKQFFQDVDDDEDWDCLEFPNHGKITTSKFSKL